MLEMCVCSQVAPHRQVLQLLHALTRTALAASPSVRGCVKTSKVGREVKVDIFIVVHGKTEKKNVFFVSFLLSVHLS